MSGEKWSAWRKEDYNQTPVTGLLDMSEELQMIDELFGGGMPSEKLSCQTGLG